MASIIKIPVGKNGVTENFVFTLKNAFNTQDTVKVAVHQHKKETKKIAEEILKKLGKQYTTKIIGFTIAIKKWRKARK